MIGDKLYFIEFRHCEGTIQSGFAGRDFLPNTPEDEWPRFRVLNPDKNQAIDEMIAKLRSLKD